MSRLGLASGGLPPKFHSEWDAISRERDPEFRMHSLYQLAGRLERDDHPEAAAKIYSSLIAGLPPLPRYAEHPLPPILGPFGARERGNQRGFRQKIPSPLVGEGQGEGDNFASSSIRSRAEERLKVLQGQGPFGAAVESWASRFFRAEHLLPNLLGLGTAQIFARSARALAFGLSLSKMSQFGFGTMGVSAARALAGTTSLFLEAPVFVLGTRGVRSLLGEANAPQQDLGKEIQGAWLWLGAMRLAGWCTPALLRPAASLGGVFLGQGLEAWAGLKEFHGSGEFIREGLANFLQAAMMGHLSGRFLGGGFRAFEWQLELSAHSRLAQTRMRGLGTEAPSAVAAPNVPSVGSPGPTSAARLFRDAPYKIEGNDSGSSSLKAEGDFFSRLTPLARGAVDRIQQEIGPNLDLARVLSQVGIQDRARIETSLLRLRHVLQSSSRNGSQGSYLNWASRIWLEQIIRLGKSDRMEAMLNLLHDGATLGEFERRLAEDVSELQLPKSAGILAPVQRRLSAEYRRLKDWPVKGKALDLIWSYSEAARPPAIAEEDWEEPSVVLNRVREYFNHAFQLEGLESILKAATQSPVPLLRMMRLGNVLKEVDELTYTKLEELSDPKFRILNVHQAPPDLPAESLRGTQFDAYLDYSFPLNRLQAIHRQAFTLMDTRRALEAAAERNRRLGAIILDGQSSLDFLDEAVFATLFGKLGDSLSLEIQQALTKREFDFHFLEGGDFEAKRWQLLPRKRGQSLGPKHTSNYIYPGMAGPKGIMLIRKQYYWRPSFRSLKDTVFDLMGNIVHEYFHHSVRIPLIPTIEPAKFVNELGADSQEILWRAHWGDIDSLKEFHVEGAAGFALYHRDLYERFYLGRERG